MSAHWRRVVRPPVRMRWPVGGKGLSEGDVLRRWSYPQS